MKNIYNYIMRFPFTYIIYMTISFAIGISLAFIIKKIYLVYIFSIIAFILIIISIILNCAKKTDILLLFISCIFIGYDYTIIRYYNNFSNSIGNAEENIKAFSAYITKYDGVWGIRKRYIAKVDSIYDGTNWKKTGGNIRIYNQSMKELYIKDKIIVSSGLKLYKNILTNDNEKYDNKAIIKNLENKMIYGVSTIYRNGDFTLEKDGFSIFNFINKYSIRLRHFVKKALGEYLNPITYSVAQCLVTGDKSIIPHDIQKVFIEAGIAHLLAVSGLHLSMVLLIVTIICSFLPINFYKKLIIAASIAIIIYFPLTLYSISVIRAGIMAICIVISFYFDRNKNSINALFVAALIILLKDPNTLRDISFQFSFLATLGILLYYPIYESIVAKKINKVINYFFKAIFINLSALIITMPLSIYYFSVLNINSILSNIFAIPISFVVLSSSVLTVVVYAIFPEISIYPSKTLEVSTNLLLNISKIFANMDILKYTLVCNFNIAIFLIVISSIIGFYLYIKLVIANPK